MKKIEFLNKESNKIVTLPLDKKMIFNQKLKNSISMISIVKEINESDSDYINKILNNNKNDHTIGKFIRGGILWWLLGIIVLFFYNAFNKEDNKKGKKFGNKNCRIYFMCNYRWTYRPYLLNYTNDIQYLG